MRNVRQAVTRVERAGYTSTSDGCGDIPRRGDRESLRRQAAAWRGRDRARLLDGARPLRRPGRR